MDEKIQLEQLKPYYGEIVKIIDKTREYLQNTINVIYYSNKKGIEKSRLITSEIFQYIRNSFDQEMVSILSTYKDTKLNNPSLIIEEIIIDINTGINTINEKIKNIDDQLNQAYYLIHNNSNILEESYKTFQDEILKLKKELNDKKNDIDKIKGYEDQFNEILICLDHSNDKEKILNSIINHNNQIKIIDSYTYEKSPIYNHIKIYLL